MTSESYAPEQSREMADEEAELDPGPVESISETIGKLGGRLENLREVVFGESFDSSVLSVQSSSEYCQQFCGILLEFAGRWRIEEEPLPLVHVYIVGLLSYAKASPYLSLQCENVSLVIEKLCLSFLELLLSVKDVPDELWKDFKSSVQFAHSKLAENGINQLSLLSALAQNEGIWTNKVLQGLLFNENLQPEQVEEFLVQEGPILLQMRVKQLMKEKLMENAALLAKTCSEYPAFQGKGAFKQMYLVCLCATLEQDQLMDELSKEDCQDALEMICNLDSEGDDGAAFSLCSAFLTRQLLQGDTYCAWELTLLWSKLLKRLESSDQAFLDRCHKMSLVSKSVYHILFLIKVIQSEIDQVGLPVCIEMCIRALKMKLDDEKTKGAVCKTISCLLPADLEVKRACQLTEFLLEPTVDAYYAVGTLYNEPDQKVEEENMPISNSLRCELLLVLKTQWPFDPEFWDWKTLKRHCLALMGEEASIVSSIDSLNEPETPEEDYSSQMDYNVPDYITDGTYGLQDVTDKKQRNREMKKLREKGLISARFRNWQAYMQYCVLCDKEFLGHRIVRHAQVHLNSGVYSCPICTQTFTSRDTLIPHVTSHVKQSSKERLTTMKTNKSLVHSKTFAQPTAALKSKTLHQLHKNNSSLQQNKVRTHSVKQSGKTVVTFNAEISEDNMCPVGQCRRSFKFFKNLIAHVKGHEGNEEAKTFLQLQNNKVVCQYCRRHFISVTHLNDHLQVHCGVRPYICIQLNCKASFLSNTDLFIHKRTHTVFKAKCMFPNCGKIFNAAFKLYDHEAHHYKTFTCKVLNCGKVFHSQQQLDLHLENHNVKKNKTSIPPQSSTNVQPGPSPAQQMLSNPSLPKQDESQDNAGGTVKMEHGERPVFIESLLETPQEPLETITHGKVKCEPPNLTVPTSPMYHPSNSVIQSVQSHLGDANRHREVCHSFECGTKPQRKLSVPPFEAGVGNLPQRRPQPHPSNVNTKTLHHNSNHNTPLSMHQGSMSCRNMLTVSLSRLSAEAAMSQPLPPTVSPKQPERIPENSIKPSKISGPPPGQRERFHCAFASCERHYSSYKNVGKHMKTAHTDFYEQWKLARTKIKITYCPARSASSVGHLSSASLLQKKTSKSVLTHGAQTQNVIQSPPYTDRTKSSNHPDVPSPPHNINGSLLMANVLNPIVLSQLGTERNLTAAQSQDSDSKSWPPVAGSEQSHNSGSTPVFQPNQKVISNSATLPHASLCSMKASAKTTSESQQLNSGSQSFIPSCIKSAKELMQHAESPPPCTPSQSSLISASETPEKMTTNPVHQQLNCSSLEANQSNNNQPQYDPEHLSNQKPPRKYTRTKCPAIVKDGKIFCRRCFRQFASTKSLGGHLSKRTICKPYQESELNADLPQSFLNLLNSEEMVGTSGSQPSYSGAAAVYHKSNEMVTSGLSATKEYSPPTKNQQNLPRCENGKSNEDILKQIMAESNMSDLFVDPPVPQPLFQNPCGPFGVNEHFLGTSVIQHTENVQLKQETNPYGAGHCSQPGISRFPESKFPDPLLSQLLAEPPPTAGMSSTSTTSGVIHGTGYHPKATSPTLNLGSKSVMQTLFDGPLGRAIMSCGQSDDQRKMAEINIKKRLREQILAGDFQRRNNLCHSGNSDPKTNPRSPGSGASPSRDCGFYQFSHGANSGLVNNGQVCEGSFGGMPGSSGEIEQLLNTQGFTCFRETAIVHEELPSPPVISASNQDFEPSEISDNQQQCLAEIQFAFERLDLIREKSDPLSTCVKERSAQTNNQMARSKSKPKKSVRSVSSTFVKPFACDICPFSSMSGEALWKHLSKEHNYTIEMVNTVKRRYGQYAPFKCLKCTKAFTRNSNLRAHYLSAHKLSTDEITELDVRRRMAKAAADSAIRNQLPSINCSSVAAIPKSHHLSVNDEVVLHPPQGSVKQEPFVPHSNSAISDLLKPQGDNHCSVIRPLQPVSTHSLEMAPSPQMCTTDFQTVQAGMASERLSQPQRNVPKVHIQQITSQFYPVIQDLSVKLIREKDPLTNKKGLLSRTDVVKLNVAKKTRGRKPKSGDSLSPYKPYRCVHQGCMAAFAIQHNLILHYRAVHQSALSALAVNEEQDQSDGADELTDCPKEEPEPEVPQENEFRCRVKDCCCIFQEVPNLFLHYLQLHEFSIDKVGSLLSETKLGKFTCGHQGCTASFTTFRKYVNHIKEEHKDLNLVKSEQLQVSFRCEMEGCDRTYATKSNMLRHLMKKHNDLYQRNLKKYHRREEQTKQKSKLLQFKITKASNGKENIESNKKILLRTHRTKRVGRPKNKHWLKYGNPSLKSKLEAAALCTKKFPLQYACMIKSCTSVMKSERSILKHYVGHGLSEKYLEQHRSHFIFCKKFSKLRCRSIRSDDSKSDNTSDLSDSETAADPVQEEGESDSSKPVLRRRNPAVIPVVLFDAKLSTDESSNGSVVLKRKRGRPRKFHDKFVKRKKLLQTTKTENLDPVICKEEVDSCPPVVTEKTEQSVPLASFKPMGFEMSFLKFLEQSNKPENSTRPVAGNGKVQAGFNPKNTCVKFSNRQNLKSLGRVKIHLDAAFSGVTDSMLKQLQDMCPAVVIEK